MWREIECDEACHNKKREGRERERDLYRERGGGEIQRGYIWGVECGRVKKSEGVEKRGGVRKREGERETWTE